MIHYLRRHGYLPLLGLHFLFLIAVTPTLMASEVEIFMLGDSLTAGYGVEKDKAYPAQTQLILSKAGHKVKVTNAGVSGATTRSAHSRLKWRLSGKSPVIPDYLFLALGANDGLRGIDPDHSYQNLAKTIELAQSKGVKVLLAGMMMPPNYGREYQQKFRAIFPKLAKKYKIPLMPFLLKNIAGEKALNLPDGIHPNDSGHALMAKNAAAFLTSQLNSPKKSSPNSKK